jgi:hypothetical protein
VGTVLSQWGTNPPVARKNSKPKNHPIVHTIQRRSLPQNETTIFTKENC